MTTRDLTIDGVRLRVAEEGEGEPLVLLHGWGASLKFWRENIPAFAARHRVIAFDWPGFGESDRPDDAPYTVEWYASLLTHLLDALGIASAVLVGHSMGGAVAMAFTLAHPQRVRRLILVNAPLQGATAFSWRVKLMSLPVLRWLGFLLGKVGWIRRLCAGFFTHSVPMYPDVIADAGRCTYATITRSALSLRCLDLAPRFGELRCPTHVVFSECDLLVRPDHVELQRTIPGATVTIHPETGHCPPVERPTEFNRDVLAFLARSPSPVPAA